MHVPAHIRRMYESAVERGRALLDKYDPAWRKLVHKFTMADPDACLICCVSKRRSYIAAKRELDIEWENGANYGFDVFYKRPETDYDLLQQLWTEVLLETPEAA